MSTEWLNRGLFTSPYHIALCLSQRDYERSLAGLKVKPENRDGWPHPEKHAVCHHFIAGNGALCAIVTMDPPREYTGCQIAALLCHEAVHIWQHIVRHIGERDPSDEFMAYSIQNIAQELMQSYVKQAQHKPGSKSWKRK